MNIAAALRVVPVAKLRKKSKSRAKASKPFTPKRPLDWSKAGAPACLNATKLRIIRKGGRWRSDAVQPWKRAPTSAEADMKAKAAATRLAHRNFATIPGARVLSRIIRACRDDVPCGSHACPRCGQVDQRWLVAALKPVLAIKDRGFRDRTFNFVMPEGQTAVSALADAPFAYILSRIRAALLACPNVLFAVFAIDISANDDSNKFLDGKLRRGRKKYFQAHVYGIVRTSRRKAVWRALRPLFPKSANIYRPLWISKDPFDGSAYGISYVLKPHGVRHAPYKDVNGEWVLPKYKPLLKPREHVHYLLATHKLGLAGRVGFVGLRPAIAKTRNGKAARVVLRRVARGESDL
jgi:hypothetical protein